MFSTFLHPVCSALDGLAYSTADLFSVSFKALLVCEPCRFFQPETPVWLLLLKLSFPPFFHFIEECCCLVSFIWPHSRALGGWSGGARPWAGGLGPGAGLALPAAPQRPEVTAHSFLKGTAGLRWVIAKCPVGSQVLEHWSALSDGEHGSRGLRFLRVFED